MSLSLSLLLLSLQPPSAHTRMQVHVCKPCVGARCQSWLSFLQVVPILFWETGSLMGDLWLISQQHQGSASLRFPSERIIGTCHHVQFLVGFVAWTQVLMFVRQTLYLLNYFPSSRILLYSFYPQNSPTGFCKISSQYFLFLFFGMTPYSQPVCCWAERWNCGFQDENPKHKK